MHLSPDLLSAYLDGEIAADERASAEMHLRACPDCAEALEGFRGLERALSASPALSCAAARPLVSARLDGELEDEDARAAAVHLRRCPDCRSASIRWDGVEAALAALPLAAPSARVDEALLPLRRAPAPRRRRLLELPAWPVRTAVTVAVALALIFGTSPSNAPETVLVPGESVVVASIQQSVLNPRTGTLYVLQPDDGAVAALDAATLAPRTTITVGGRPSALALSVATNSILVLDSSSKTLTEIDGNDNSVIGATSIPVPGTPTSLQVDGNSGKVVITSIISAGAAPAPPLPLPLPSSTPQSPTKTTSGAVSLVDVATKKIETINQVDVAPRQVVLDPDGKRALLVSTDSTTIVDAATYKALDRAAGGIAAAFSVLGGEYAILSARGSGALVTFGVHPSVTLGGLPRAIAALPDGAFAVLTESGGHGRITVVGPDGTLGAAQDGPIGRDMTYDPDSGLLSIVGGAGVTNVGVPSALALQPAASSQPRSVAPAQASALPSASPSPVPSAAPSPSSIPVVGASPAPSPSSIPQISPAAPSAAPQVVSSPDLIPTGARPAWPGTYVYAPLAGARASLVAGDPARIWIVDERNRLSTLHTATGEIFQIAQLPKEAKPASLLLTREHVYLPDTVNGKLYVFDVKTEQLSAGIALPFIRLATAFAASSDGRLWIGTDGFGLLSYEATSRRENVIDIGRSRISALGVDVIGRVWIGPRGRDGLQIYDPLNGKLAEVSLPRQGAVIAFSADPQGRMWVGTDSGEIFAIRNSRLDGAAQIKRSVDEFVSGLDGSTWWVNRGASEVVYGPADGSLEPIHAPAGSSSPVFDSFGRSWTNDRASGVFLVSLRDGGR